jgi:hypothetical protein
MSTVQDTITGVIGIIIIIITIIITITECPQGKRGLQLVLCQCRVRHACGSLFPDGMCADANSAAQLAA